MNIRLANPSDSGGIARAHVDSWKTAYKGIISDRYLDNLSYEGRAKNWKWVFDHPQPDEVIFVAEERGAIVGFINGGKSRESALDYDAELYALYLVRDAQGKGYGKLLYNSLVEHIKKSRYQSMMVWVLERNPSMAFYQKLGGQFVGRKEIRIGDDVLFEAALGWKELG
ncbi:GNAT family N-acetyltransferase [Paenibacillus spongiae]|uniref:GNAT family N-acetyltransferase n=1 Tax=Paenibacillus spongiae TaxID=2909671 RepID=A0ABY5SJ91_9BACL|nr:GNAT family N-acetyltransferase [Paenibacillus spongiae]UVI32740.1 GNAT family N-acetyltransferase [Paenibacillus spongiae]